MIWFPAWAFKGMGGEPCPARAAETRASESGITG